MEKDIEIRRCLQRKDGVKMVIVPKNSKIEKDDYVCIYKINKEVKNGRGKRK